MDVSTAGVRVIPVPPAVPVPDSEAKLGQANGR
jgi:hypothetical protein